MLTPIGCVPCKVYLVLSLASYKVGLLLFQEQWRCKLFTASSEGFLRKLGMSLQLIGTYAQHYDFVIASQKL